MSNTNHLVRFSKKKKNHLVSVEVIKKPKHKNKNKKAFVKDTPMSQCPSGFRLFLCHIYRNFFSLSMSQLTTRLHNPSCFAFSRSTKERLIKQSLLNEFF